MSATSPIAWSAPGGVALESREFAGLARTAATLAQRDTLESLLSALADEIFRLDEVAGVQVVLIDAGNTLRIMGSAGFARDPEFFGNLNACRLRGADLATFAALEHGGGLIFPERKAQMLASDAWLPLHPYLREVEWSDFVSLPFPLQRRQGVINSYMSVGATLTPSLATFLQSMADLAAVAIDYHDLLEQGRESVRRVERQRVAQDLHDSVLQKVFAMVMQTTRLHELGTTLGERGKEIVELADEFQRTSLSVQREIRDIIEASRPGLPAHATLRDATEAYLAQWRRGDVTFVVEIADIPDSFEPPLVDDAYFLVTESVFNALRHASASEIRVRVTVEGDALRVEVADDGRGFEPDAPSSGFGLDSMRHRAERWAGRLDIAAADGTSVSAILTSDPQGAAR